MLNEVQLSEVPVPSTPKSPEVVEAVVASLRGGRIRLKVGDGAGVLMIAGVSREILYEELAVGQRIPVRPMGPGGRGETNYSAKGLIRSSWERIADEYRVGDVVRGKVVKVDEKYALVELLPQAAGMVPLGEVDVERCRDAREVLTEGEVVSVKILQLAPQAKKCLLSIRKALGNPVKERIALVPGGRPFPREHGEADRSKNGDYPVAANWECSSLDHASAVQERDRLATENRGLRSDLASARKDLKAEKARADALESGAVEVDPTKSAREFLLAVRLEYARRFEEGDRARYPLRPMTVGREFMESLRALTGIPIEKVIEVCAQAASGMVKDMPSREAHRAGHGGSGGATRKSDGAKGWRCYLQSHTPGARRLHWWDVPGDGGGSIEFASVGHHDEFDVPE